MADVMATENPTGVLTAKSILRDDVVNRQGEHLGDIRDLMISLQEGCISYAVLDFGGFLGIGSKYFAVPWQSFTVDEDNRQLILDMTKDQLRDSPGFDKDHWPMTNDAYYTSVDDYYGTYGGYGGNI